MASLGQRTRVIKQDWEHEERFAPETMLGTQVWHRNGAKLLRKVHLQNSVNFLECVIVCEP